MSEEEKEILDLVRRYEDMVDNNIPAWFDSMEWVDIIDYYEDNEQDDRLEQATLRAYKKFPDDEDIVVRMANLYLNKEEYKRAENLIKDYIKEHPSEELRGLLAGVYVESGTHLKKAEQILKELLLEESELDPYYSYLLARIYIEKSKFAQAEKLLRNVVKIHYDDWALMMNYVKCVEDKQVANTVLRTIRSIVNKNPFEDKVWVALAFAYYESYHIDKALEAINYAIAIDSDEETRHALKANIVVALGKDEEYIKESLLAAEYATDKYTYYESIGKAYLNKKDYKNASIYYKKALEHEKFGLELPESNLGLVECYLMQNQITMANRQLDKALAMQYPPSYYLGFAERISSLGFSYISEDILAELTNSDDILISMLATVSLAYIKAETDRLLEGIKLLEDTIKDYNDIDSLYYALLDLSCRDSKYIAYTRKALQYLIAQKGYNKNIRDNFPSLLKNGNYLKCLKELINE